MSHSELQQVQLGMWRCLVEGLMLYLAQKQLSQPHLRLLFALAPDDIKENDTSS